MTQPDGVSWKEWVNDRFEAQEKALVAAKSDMERRLEAMNEFRAQLEKQATTFLTTDRYEACHGRLVDQINFLERQQAAAEARGKVYTVVVASLMSILVALVVYFITGR